MPATKRSQAKPRIEVWPFDDYRKRVVIFGTEPFQVPGQVAEQAGIQFDSASRKKITQVCGKKGFQMKGSETTSQKDSQGACGLCDRFLEPFQRINQIH